MREALLFTATLSGAEREGFVMTQAQAEHQIRCVFCKSENVESAPNSEGAFYCHCTTCGTRFWAH